MKNISFLSSVLVKTMVILLFLICVISDSHARDDVERYSGKVLLEDFQVCDESPQAYRCGRAANYVKGFAKRILQGMAGNPSNSKICMEVNVGLAELTDVVRLYLENNIDRHRELAVWIVRDALLVNYPCQ